MALTRKQLIATAKELNVHPDDGGAVGFEPPINVKLPLAKLGAEILRKCNGVAVDDDGNEHADPLEGLLAADALSDEAWAVCAALGNAVAIGVVKSFEEVEAVAPEPEPEPEPPAPKVKKKRAPKPKPGGRKEGNERTARLAAILAGKEKMTHTELVAAMGATGRSWERRAIWMQLTLLIELGFCTVDDNGCYVVKG